MEPYTQQALAHVRHLSVAIGGRGSCTPAERRAADYVAEQMRQLRVGDVRVEPCAGSASTYRPYALAFGAALLGTLLVWLVAGRWAMAGAAVLSALGAWGMLAEADLSPNWMRWLLPRATSCNAVGVIRPTGPVEGRVVLCAHLDTHRTPIFYSSKAWQRAFGLLVGGTFVTMVVEAIAYGVGAVTGWPGSGWIGLATAPLQLFALGMCLHAELTPFSPGANDNASGVGVTLGLASRLAEAPLDRTEIWLAFTGCEEVGGYGMAAFLDAHAGELGSDAIHVVLDQIGIGRLTYLTSEGLIWKRRAHPRALELARLVSRSLPGLGAREMVGLAYTDALVATKRGLVSLSLCSLPLPPSQETVHWHQMSDTVDAIDRESLADAHTFTWELLQRLDRPEER